ncbi:MAG: SprT family zinc-dependent metalloprotease [Bacteroidales bacterium]
MNRTENVIQYADFGEIRYIRNRRAKNMAIRIGRNGDIKVTVPGFVSLKRAESFVFSRGGWIVQKINEQKRHSVTALTISEGGVLTVRGRQITVRLKDTKDTLEEAIWRILLKEGAAYLPGRVTDLGQMHGLRFSGVKVRRMKSRWGSCTARNGINLNSWLMMLPEYLSDYVILHELAHTRHRNHGPEFWEYLDRLTGGRSKQLRKELRRQQIMLINPK